MKLSLRHEAADPGRGEGPPEPPEPPPGTHEPPPPDTPEPLTEPHELPPTVTLEPLTETPEPQTETPEPPSEPHEPPELDTAGTSGRLGSVRDGSTGWVCEEDPDVAVAVT